MSQVYTMEHYSAIKQIWTTDACSNMDEPQNYFVMSQMQDYIA